MFIEIIVSSILGFFMSIFGARVVRSLEEMLLWKGRIEGAMATAVFMLVVFVLLRKEK